MTPPSRWSREWWGGVLPIPTVRLAWLVAGAGVLSLLLPVVVGVIVFGGLVVAAFVVDAVRAPAPWVLSVERDLPAAVPLGASADLTWRVRNPTERSCRVHLADQLAPSLEAEDRRAWVTLPPRGRATATTTLQPSRRGAFRPREITLRVFGPWQLAGRQYTYEVPGLVKVVPSFRSRREAELRIRRTRILEVGLRSVRGRGGGTEFEQLREYGPDDEFRRIDWAATARAGKPIVRTYRAERNQHVLLLVDVGRIMAGQVEGVPRLDHAMDAALALTTVAGAVGDRVGVVAFGAEIRAVVPPARTAGQLNRVVEGLYQVEPELAESAYRPVFAETLARFQRRSLLVLLTELASEAVTATLEPALPLILREHEVIVGSVRDPQVESWRDTPPDDVTAAYRAAAAVAALADRDLTASRLRSLGARVVDEAPDRLAGALADRYLDLKATGRL